MSRIAVLQVADTGPLESLVVMLRSVGYECRLPNAGLRDQLRTAGLDNVEEIDRLVSHWGYERPFDLPEAGISDLLNPHAIYVDVKAHRNGAKVAERWGSDLRRRTLWYRINGAAPEIVPNKAGGHRGDEVNLWCPVLTPNQWYHDDPSMYPKYWDGKSPTGPEWGGMAYTCWPPFYRFADYGFPRGVQESIKGTLGKTTYEPPMCLVHNLAGWGYGALVSSFRERLGVRLYGVRSPDGLINHREIPRKLAFSLAYVHLKSSDAPGYALYEALAAGCPVICTRRLIWRCRMGELLIPGETCLTFDRETHEGLTDEDVRTCTKEVGDHLERLKDPVYNAQIGEAGRARLKEVMWSADKPTDVESLKKFMVRHYGEV